MAPGQQLVVVGSERRVLPAWDGHVYPMVGVGSPTGTVISVPSPRTAAVRALADLPLDDLLEKLPTALGLAGRRKAYRGVFRYCLDPTALPDAGSGSPSTIPWCRSGCGRSAARC
ncbi:hypothetical protein Prum_029090 [Phytohabitans rumicis]|uniref:Uncharacterized protein n=1 Tax=Phytohabitans rumicis TaxID=1076125 RepID=A0A6V8L5A8_9ACTN|nr:hypothetical protein Prum_029090 [Phytohabitans rumicis]